jgi:diguanylate cyclase (GGDEF)-like protein/PAS domain S-box-containing protein
MKRMATILIVDDQEANRRLLEVLLKPEGYLTITAADGHEALEAVADNSVDLILLDVMMPNMDGYQLASILKADTNTKSIPIIMVTAQVDRETRLAALETGVEEFLTKPVDRAELWLRVRNLLRLKEYGDLLADYSVVLEQRVAERTAHLHRFRMAMDSAADAIFLTDRTTMTILEVNATASQLLGYSRDELLGSYPHEIYGEPVDHLEKVFDSLIAGDTTNSVVKTRQRRKDGTLFPVELHRYAHRSGDDWIIVTMLRDITDREAAEERLQHLAHYDALTGLPNRTLFYDTLKKSLLRGAHENWQLAVMFLDVDHFKNVNDTLGHAVGDKLLTDLANRLVGCVRLRDTVGRLGGDEFGLILAMEKDELGAVAVANKIRVALRAPFDVGGNHVTVTASIGITMYPADAARPATLIRYADTAMYGAKQAGRDTFRFFKPQMNSDVHKRLKLEQSLRKAIDNDEFVLHYQPKVHVSSGRIVGLEALLRWEKPGSGVILPDQFVPALEETGLISEVGRWVIRQACKQIAAWARSDVGAMRVAVNVSGRQFLDTDLDGEIGAALLAHGVAADALELELTESSLIPNTERTIATLRKLKARGVQVSIDDFGTGYSCLAYLRKFPIDTLKIDLAFIRNVTTDPADAAMTETIIRMAHSLRMDVIAEGVETAAQLSYLARQGCDQVQGFYFSRALPVLELEQLLRDGTSLPVHDGAAHPPRTTVLLVDEDIATLAALEALLEQDGYHIVTSTSGAEALELLALHNVQVIVCGGETPLINRAEFLQRVRDLYPNTLRIVLSASTDPRRVIDAVNSGALYGFYAKPWDDEILRNNVGAACRHHRRLQDGAVASAALAPDSMQGLSRVAHPIEPGELVRKRDPNRTPEVASLDRVAG